MERKNYKTKNSPKQRVILDQTHSWVCATQVGIPQIKVMMSNLFANKTSNAAYSEMTTCSRAEISSYTYCSFRKAWILKMCLKFPTLNLFLNHVRSQFVNCVWCYIGSPADQGCWVFCNWFSFRSASVLASPIAFSFRIQSFSLKV